MLAEGRILEAESIYRSLAASGTSRPFALEALAEIYWNQGRADESIEASKELTATDPNNLHYCAELARRLDSVGRTAEAIEEYQRLLRDNPEFPVAHYNIALLHTKLKQYAEALSAYKKAIELNIDNVEEVYSNMGVLYSAMEKPDDARKMYERALEIAPDYVPAMFNFAGYFEEVSDKDRALELYERILTIDPTHWRSLARIAYPQRISGENKSLVERLERSIAMPKEDLIAQEGLCFALGKVCDDLGLYEKAAAAYTEGNRLGKARCAPYNRQATEQGFDQLIELFDASWITENATDSRAKPIFICGMFRTGSTLLEQMLGAHPSITAGGELEIMPWLVGSKLSPYPAGVRSASREQLRRVGDEYVARVGSLFPGQAHVTDKRPDNYLHIGLIKLLFPAARIIHTRRGLLDNCLSLYFQQLGGGFAYATDIEDTAHYIRQHDRLIAHWASCLGDDIMTVDYEEIVESPEPVMRRVLDYIGVEWNESVLKFRKTKGLVKTPSLWQVREKLHTRSNGRWKNYPGLIKNLQAASREE